MIAVLLAAALLLACPLSALAASRQAPDLADVVTAVQADLQERAAAASKLSVLSVRLLRVLTEKAKNTEITVEDVKSAVDETSRLLAKVYEKMGSYASKMLDKAKDKISDTIDSLKPEPETEAPSNPSNPSNPANPANPSNPSNPTNPTEPTEPEEPEEPAEKITFADMAEVMKKYVFIRVDNPEEVAELIAESCEFTYTTVEDGDGTVYIRVDIEKNPQIFNYAVFRNLVEDLYEQQGEEMLKNEDGSVDYLMSYEHIAGELALHALLYAASDELLRVGVESGRLLSLYKSAARADLNVDEARIPAEAIAIVGVILMNMMSYHLLTALGLI
jgi:hypothetical protein